MSASEQRTVGDMKAGLTGAKPKLSILPRTAMNYQARGTEYGEDKYARGNYHGPPPAALGSGLRAGALRLLGYIDATQRHLTNVSDALNRALGTGGDLAAAACTRDTDSNGKFPPSNLPDLAHAIASIGIGISCAADDGLIPVDPGRPWDAALKTAAIPQKDDPAAERARVAALQAQSAIIDGKWTRDVKTGEPVIVDADELRRVRDREPPIACGTFAGLRAAIEATPLCAHFTAIIGPCTCDITCACVVDGPCGAGFADEPTKPEGVVGDCTYAEGAVGKKLNAPICGTHNVPLEPYRYTRDGAAYRCRLTLREVTR